MAKYNATVKVRYFVYVEVDAHSRLDADKAAEEIVNRHAPHEIKCDGNDSERSSVEVIGVEEKD